MKQPTKLTREQKEMASSQGLNPNDWMLEKKSDFYLYLVKKDGTQKKHIDAFIRRRKK